jgi:integrase/recombinase XerD
MQLSGENGVIEQYMTDCDNRGHSESTQAGRRRLFGWLVRWLESKGVTELEGVTPLLLRQFLSFLLQSEASDRSGTSKYSSKLSPVTVSTYLSYLKAFFNWCCQEDLIPSNPAVRLKGPKVPEKVVASLTPEQVEKLLAVCDLDTNIGFRDYVIVLLFLDTGMRVSELANLRISDVHTKYVRVDGKGYKEREVGLHPDVSKLLWKYINKYRVLSAVDTDIVFLSERGPLKRSGVEYVIGKIKKRSGIDGMRVSPHVFRHTHSKRYLKRGGDIFKLSRELGHSNVQITSKVYLGDYKSSDARDEHDKYSAVEDIKIERYRERRKGKRNGK